MNSWYDTLKRFGSTSPLDPVNAGAEDNRFDTAEGRVFPDYSITNSEIHVRSIRDPYVVLDKDVIVLYEGD